MSTAFEQGLFEVQSVMAAGAVVITALWLLLHRLGRSRPELRIGRAVAAGVTLRVVAAAALSEVAPGARGTDETTFLERARSLLDSPLTGSESIQAFTSEFHVWLFALQLRIPDFPEFAMRLLQVGISVAGLLLLLAAVYDLAGGRAAGIAAWLTMLEPSSIFFSSFLHKEPFMLFGAGLVAFGGARLWHRRDPHALLLMAAGGSVATVARPYAGAMLFVAIAAIGLHGSIAKRGPMQRRSLVTGALILVVLLAGTPAALNQTSDERLLSRLQTVHDINASDESNLKLGRVDFSTRTNIILNLPKRMVDVAFRPFPWELGSTNQRLGLPGTLVALAVMLLLIRELLTPRGLFGRAGPVLYPAVFLFLAFSLSSGNAGTAFRLRSTVVSLAIAAIVVLRIKRAQQRAAELEVTTEPAQLADSPRPPRPTPASIGSTSTAGG